MNSPYQPPTSRPAHGGIAHSPKSTLWHGFGLGWAAIAFTFLWVVVAVPLFSRFVAIGNGFESILSLVLLFAPTLALLAYFAVRKDWKGVLGVLLTWASAIALVLLLVAAWLGILGSGA